MSGIFIPWLIPSNKQKILFQVEKHYEKCVNFLTLACSCSADRHPAYRLLYRSRWNNCPKGWDCWAQRQKAASTTEKASEDAASGEADTKTADSTALAGKKISVMTPYLTSVTTNQMAGFIKNNLEAEGAEACCSWSCRLFAILFYNQNFKVSHLGMKKSKHLSGRLGVQAVEWFGLLPQKPSQKANIFTSCQNRHLAEMASDIVSLGNQTGEGWFLTGEMLELIENGAQNIICAQPFACLPNHVVGKGVIKRTSPAPSAVKYCRHWFRSRRKRSEPIKPN
mgnify:CR=1 FL=1